MEAVGGRRGGAPGGLRRGLRGKGVVMVGRGEDHTGINLLYR